MNVHQHFVCRMVCCSVSTSCCSIVQVVQPLFYFLAEQMDLVGHQGGEEAALRIAYCDVNEACCSPKAVLSLIKHSRRRVGSAWMSWAADTAGISGMRSCRYGTSMVCTPQAGPQHQHWTFCTACLVSTAGGISKHDLCCFCR